MIHKQAEFELTVMSSGGWSSSSFLLSFDDLPWERNVNFGVGASRSYIGVGIFDTAPDAYMSC
jgi:hypothetical protein